MFKSFCCLTIACIFLTSCTNGGTDIETAFAENYQEQMGSEADISSDSALCYAKQFLSNVDSAKLEANAITIVELKAKEVTLDQIRDVSLFESLAIYETVKTQSLDCLSEPEVKRLVLGRTNLRNEDITGQVDCVLEDLGKTNFLNLLVEAQADPESESATTLEESFTRCEAT